MYNVILTPAANTLAKVQLWLFEDYDTCHFVMTVKRHIKIKSGYLFVILINHPRNQESLALGEECACIPHNIRNKEHLQRNTRKSYIEIHGIFAWNYKEDSNSITNEVYTKHMED